MDKNNMNEVIDRIKAKRLALNFSYQDLADLTGLSKSTLQRYETGFIRNLSVDKLETLATALETTPGYLMGWEYDYSNNKKTDPNMVVKESPSRYELDKITTANEALEFILQQPTLMNFGGYDTEEMTEDDLVSFANDLLLQLKLISYKYKK